MSANSTTRDFPDWLGPMLVKELRQGLKTKVFVATFLLLQAIFVAVMIFNALDYRKRGLGFDTSRLTNFFWMLIGAQLLVITPARAFNELAGERKANTLELIYMTGLTPWRIVLGKWGSLLFQSILFLVAILPYAVLRYYFGSINLVDDFSILALLLMASAVLSAAALAASGMPLFVRIIVVILVGLLVFGSLSSVVFRLAFGRGSSGSVGPSDSTNWFPVAFDAVILCLVALEVAAASIAPPSENHAAPQRLISWLALLLSPLLLWTADPRESVKAQCIVFALIGCFTAWRHLAVFPAPLRCHLEPFAKRRWLSFPVAAFLQPGWPSAALYLFLSVGGLVAIDASISRSSRADTQSICAFFLLSSAALISPPILWRIIRRRPKWPLLEYTLFFVFFGVVAIFMHNLRPYSFYWGPGDNPVWALFPPLGVFLLLDDDGVLAKYWLVMSAATFVAYFLFLQMSASAYWRRLWALYCEIRRAQISPPAS